MKKRYVLPIVGAIASVGVGYMMKNKNNSSETTLIDTLENAGKPYEKDSYETDQFQNSKMVSEGSQFGVQYYNKATADKMIDELEEKITD